MLNQSILNTTNFINTNVTNNVTSTEVEEVFKMTLHEWLLIAAFLLIMVVGVFGNLLVIYVFGFKKSKKSTELLILYLGVIDLMTSVFNPTLYIYWAVNNYGAWHFGALGCKILPVIGPVMTTASGWVLLIFAAERYYAIVMPFTSKFKSSTITILCLASVLCSFGMYGHYSHALTYQYGSCYVPLVSVPEYGYPNCIFIVVRLLAFLVVFSGTNIQIFRTLRKSEKTLTVKELRVQRIKQSKRIMRILNVMGVVFILLVFPRELLYLVYNTSALIYGDGDGGVEFGPSIVYINSWLKVMHTSNSCANIFIYAHMQDSYRNQLKKFLQCIGCFKFRFQRGMDSYTKTHHTVMTNDNNNVTKKLNRSDKKKFNSQSTINRRRDSERKGLPSTVFFKRAQDMKTQNDDLEPFIYI